MLKKLLIPLTGLLCGILIGMYFISFKTTLHVHNKILTQKQVIGFLPYWLLDRAHTDYSDYITTLTYFGLSVDGNGHIIKLANAQEEDPGWNALSSGKLDPFFKNARENNIKLSLLIDSGDTNAINQLVANPIPHATTLVSDVAPIMKKYHFSDLNLDIEYTATGSAIMQTQFTQFVKSVKKQLTQKQLGSLTIEISPTDAIKRNLINTQAIAPFVDTVILMSYDYHSPTSYVTGPVAPLNGAGIDSEYDVTAAVVKSTQTIPANKMILGTPLYGYEWETLNTAVRSAVIPGTGGTASDKRAQTLLATCATCSAFFDNEAQEEYILYKDPQTNTYHQFFVPIQQSMKAKIDLANKQQLGGIALWALGYEGDTILSPLANYKINE